MYFVERVNQGDSLISELNWLTEPPCCVLVSDPGGLITCAQRGYAQPVQMPSKQFYQAVLCKPCVFGKCQRNFAVLTAAKYGIHSKV